MTIVLYGSASAVVASKDERAVPRPSMRVYRDPSTGALSPEPLGEQPATSSIRGGLGVVPPGAPLVEYQNTVAGGGVVMDLEGAFLMALRARRNPSGTASAQCGPGGSEWAVVHD